MKTLAPVEITATCLQSFQSYDVNKCGIQITGLPARISPSLFKWLLEYVQCLSVNYAEQDVLLSDALQEYTPTLFCVTHKEIIKGLKKLPNDVVLKFSAMDFFESGDSYEALDSEVFYPDCEEDRERLFQDYFDDNGKLNPDIELLNI